MKKSTKSRVESKKKQCLQAIEKISQDIDNISLSDQQAWANIGYELESAVADFPKNLSVPLKMLQLCSQAVQIFAEETKTHSFTLIEALSAALSAAADYLQDKPDKKPKIQQAQSLLSQALAKEQAETDANPTAPEDPSAPTADISLDDAAALLIQLEVDDSAGLEKLKALLQALASGDGCSASGRVKIGEAAQLIETILNASADDPQAAFENAGKLLEKAMNDFEQNQGPDPDLPSDVLDASNETEQQAQNGDAPTDYMPTDSDPDLLAEFITESTDLILSAEEALLALETDPEDMDAVNMVFRAFHTIKGTAGFMNLALVAEMGHHAESLLSRVRDREIRYGGGYADLSLRALDMLKELVLSVQEALQGAPLLKPAGYDDLMHLLADPEAAGISDEQDETPAPRLGDVLVAQGKVERNQVEQAAQNHPEEKIGTAIVKEKTATVTDVGQALRTQKRMQGGIKAVETSVRVSTHRLDRLIDMIGELVIAHSMVAQDHFVVNGNRHELVKKISHSGKIVRELQDLSMSMRMVPLKATFNKMARLVRDLGRKVGKSIQFVTEGEDTEIDRNLVDIINDPLVHLVRNAVDHGIETAEIRKQNGKPEQGTVKLCAYHSAGNVVVEIEDDGKGLDREAIVTKAREKGLIEDGTTLNDREVFNLIFEPGFSTASTVTDVSGRGVGMDVVKKNIISLRGQAEIRTEAGKGSVFKVSLPLTLAIIDGMVVRVGPETYVIPTGSIVRSIKPAAGDISTVHGKGRMLSLQSQLIPLFELASLYQIAVTNRDEAQHLVVVVEDEERLVGLLIDELIGRQQVVVKTLGETMREIPGISGGAILPNGRVGLILDVGGLMRFATAGIGQTALEEINGNALAA